MKKNKNAFKIAGIIIVVIILGWLLKIAGSFLYDINKTVEYENGKLGFHERMEKINEKLNFWFDTSVMKNAPACESPVVVNLVYDEMKKNYLIDGDQVNVQLFEDGSNDALSVAGTISYDGLWLNEITLEKSDKNIQKNTCEANLFYDETLSQSNAPPKDQINITTRYKCKLIYTTQMLLDGNAVNVKLFPQEYTQISQPLAIKKEQPKDDVVENDD